MRQSTWLPLRTHNEYSPKINWTTIRKTGNISKRRRRVPVAEICAGRDPTEQLESPRVLPKQSSDIRPQHPTTISSGDAATVGHTLPGRISMGCSSWFLEKLINASGVRNALYAGEDKVQNTEPH